MHLSQTVINKIKGSLNHRLVLVVGDVMLDKYWFGEVQRISPEAPVPIAKIGKTKLFLKLFVILRAFKLRV